MCGPKLDFNCEHLPRKRVKDSTNFSVRTGKRIIFGNDSKFDVTIEIRLCKQCAENFIETMEITEADKNKYGYYTPDTIDEY